MKTELDSTSLKVQAIEDDDDSVAANDKQEDNVITYDDIDDDEKKDDYSATNVGSVGFEEDRTPKESDYDVLVTKIMNLEKQLEKYQILFENLEQKDEISMLQNVNDADAIAPSLRKVSDELSAVIPMVTSSAQDLTVDSKSDKLAELVQGLNMKVQDLEAAVSDIQVKPYQLYIVVLI
jgi:hypothetical protein